MIPPDPAAPEAVESKPFALTISAGFAAQLQAAIEMYGEPLVRWTWEAFMPPLFPFSQEIMREQETVVLAKSLGLDQADVEGAIHLTANLRASVNPHNAWLAAEGLLRAVPPGALETLRAAMEKPKGTPS